MRSEKPYKSTNRPWRARDFINKLWYINTAHGLLLTAATELEINRGGFPAGAERTSWSIWTFGPHTVIFCSLFRSFITIYSSSHFIKQLPQLDWEAAAQEKHLDPRGGSSHTRWPVTTIDWELIIIRLCVWLKILDLWCSTNNSENKPPGPNIWKQNKPVRIFSIRFSG